jgi:hypothetical protein
VTIPAGRGVKAENLGIVVEIVTLIIFPTLLTSKKKQREATTGKSGNKQ